MFKSIRKALFASPCTTVRGAASSITGKLHITDGIPNQDNSFILLGPDMKEYQRRLRTPRSQTPRSSPPNAPGVFAAAIFDGHGPQGDIASTLAVDRMKYALARHCSDKIMIPLSDILELAFKEVSAALNSAPCSSDSGTTGSVVLIREDDIAIANVGDSAVYFVSQSFWNRKQTVRHASRIHRPSDPQEAERIKAHGGHVQENYVVDSRAQSGIGVSRTLGDRDMQKFGCISDPDIHEFKITRQDKAIILASDGLWDVPGLENTKAVLAATKKFSATPRKVCERLQSAARQHGGAQDDCTIACLMFE